MQSDPPFPSSAPGPRILASLIAAALAGCTVPLSPMPSAPPIEVSPRPPETRAHPSFDSAEASPRWWDQFGDPVLADLETRAQAGNLDLATALSRVDQARAALGIAQAALAPRIGVGADRTRAAISADSPLADIGAPTQPYDQWQVGLQASWELDFWGQIRHRAAASASRLEALADDANAANVSLAAEVARQYLLLRAAQTRLDLAMQGRDLAAEAQRLAESRLRLGAGTSREADAARAARAAADAAIPKLSAQRDALANALALLVGAPPRSLDPILGASELPVLPLRLPVGVPGDAVRQRPDVQAAEARLRAAIADVGAARADFYPSVRLGAAVGTAGYEFSELSLREARQFSATAAVYLPLFEGGRLQRTLELNEARQRSAVLEWRAALLRAWHEVEDAMEASAAERAHLELLQEAARRHEQALAAARLAWEHGSTGRDEVIAAERAWLAARAAEIDARAAAALSVAGLYRALGRAEALPTHEAAPAVAEAGR